MLKRQLIIVILILSVLAIPGCKKMEDSMNISKYIKDNEEIINMYKDLLKNEESNLIDILDYLYEKDGEYSLELYSDGPNLQTSKGLDYSLDNENTKRLLEIMEKYKVQEVWHAGPSKDTIFTKVEIKDEKYIMHQLIYHVEKTDFDSQQRRYIKLADNFYYRYTYGE